MQIDVENPFLGNPRNMIYLNGVVFNIYCCPSTFWQFSLNANVPGMNFILRTMLINSFSAIKGVGTLMTWWLSDGYEIQMVAMARHGRG